MKIENALVVNMFDIETDIKLQYDVNIEMIPLFFPDTNNDCYHSLCFDEGMDETYHGYPWEDEEEILQRNLVRGYLRDVIPGGQTRILVKISW